MAVWMGLLVFTLAPALALALDTAAPLTLEEAIAIAKSHNPSYQQAEAAAEEASWKTWEALSGHLPQISLSANHAFDLKYQTISLDFQGQPITMPAIYPKTIVSAQALWNLFDGFRTWDAYQGAKLSSRAASLERDRAGFALEREIQLKYYQALAAQMLSVVADENVKTLQDHENRVKALLSRGATTRFELLRVQVQLDEAEPEQVSAQDNVATTRKALAVAMGEQSDERPLTGTLPEPAGSPQVTSLKWDPSGRADLKALNLRAEAADRAYGESLSSWYPQLSFSAEKDFYNSINYDFSGFQDAYFIGAVLKWNLFDGGASIARQKEAIARRAEAEEASRAKSLEAPAEFDTWKRKYLYEASTFSAKKQAVDAATESVRLAKAGFQAGTLTHTDLLDAELDLFRARAALVQAELESAEALIQLELSLGRKI